jgi:hypothetical protein
MFYVCQIQNNLLGQMNECEDLITALDLVKQIVKENGVELTDAVIEEIDQDWSYISEEQPAQEQWSVCVGTCG